MLPILIESIILASAGLISVGSITIIILLLMSEHGLRNGLGYMLGYTGGYILIGITITLIGYTIAENNADANEPSKFMPAMFVILGLLLLVIAQRNWRKPPSPQKENPRLLTLVDKITPLKAFLFGAAITVINFKNLALFLTAVSVPLLSDLPLPQKIIIIICDALVFCTSVIVPVLVYILLPKRADAFLSWIKHTLETKSRPISIWIPLIFGILFLLRGATGLL